MALSNASNGDTESGAELVPSGEGTDEADGGGVASDSALAVVPAAGDEEALDQNGTGAAENGDVVDEAESRALIRKNKLNKFKYGQDSKLPFAHGPPGSSNKKKHIEVKLGDLSVGSKELSWFEKKSSFFFSKKGVPRVERSKLSIRKRAEREYNSIMALRDAKYASAEEIRMEHLPGSESRSLVVAQVCKR